MDSPTPLPPQWAFFHAILQHLVTKPSGDVREHVHEAIPDLLQLSEAQRTERLPNMPHHLRYRYRSGWGLSMLKSAGYLDSPARGVWRITQRGRELPALHPEGFTEEIGRQIVQQSRNAGPTAGETEDLAPQALVSAAQQTPDERIDTAIKEIHHQVSRELLEKISQAPPAFFEQLVLEILHALRYGASEEDLERVGSRRRRGNRRSYLA